MPINKFGNIESKVNDMEKNDVQEKKSDPVFFHFQIYRQIPYLLIVAKAFVDERQVFAEFPDALRILLPAPGTKINVE